MAERKAPAGRSRTRSSKSAGSTQPGSAATSSGSTRPTAKRVAAKPAAKRPTAKSASSTGSRRTAGAKPSGAATAKTKTPTKPKPAAKKAPTKAARPGKAGSNGAQPNVTVDQAKEQARKYKRKAARYRNDPEKTEKLLKDAEEKARKNPGAVSARLQDLTSLMRLVRAYVRKDYREVPWETVALAIGAIAYFVSPIDLIPDFIPVAGYFDDAAVIGFVIASAANDLHNFREWEARQELNAN
jgi:uncharacterized membrane protein YkvA (DUF1232 family)